MQIIKQGNSFAPNSNKYKQIGVSVIYDSGILKIVVGYQWFISIYLLMHAIKLTNTSNLIIIHF